MYSIYYVYDWYVSFPIRNTLNSLKKCLGQRSLKQSNQLISLVTDLRWVFNFFNLASLTKKLYLWAKLKHIMTEIIFTLQCWGQYKIQNHSVSKHKSVNVAPKHILVLRIKRWLKPLAQRHLYFKTTNIPPTSRNRQWQNWPHDVGKVISTQTGHLRHYIHKITQSLQTDTYVLYIPMHVHTQSNFL